MVANRSESILLYLVPINVSASHYVRFSVDTLSLVPWWSHPHPCAMQSQQPQGMQGWEIKKRWRDGGRFVVTVRRTLLVCIPLGVNNSWLFAFRVHDTVDDSGEEGITGIFVCCSFVLYSSTGGNVSKVIRCYHKRCMIHDSQFSWSVKFVMRVSDENNKPVGEVSQKPSLSTPVIAELHQNV